MIKYQVVTYYKWHNEYIKMMDSESAYVNFIFDTFEDAKNYALNKEVKPIHYSRQLFDPDTIDTITPSVEDPYSIYYTLKDGLSVCAHIEKVFTKVSFWDWLKQ